MLSFKGILKYSIYLFIAGWMFVLGIMVGRGTSPVTFDTEGFQKRLQTIAREFGNTSEPEEKMDLQFYDVLNKPAQQEVRGKKNNPDEIIPKKETSYPVAKNQVGNNPVKNDKVNNDQVNNGQIKKDPESVLIPMKTSRKSATLNKAALSKAASRDNRSLANERSGVENKKALKKNGTSQTGENVKPGMYTIQIAAYKSFTDAVTHMAILDKKGFSSYRTMGKKDGVSWYRVRAGSFASRDDAKQFIEKLKQAKINGMIIKQE
jgi:cell division protein FtsN